MTVVRYILSSIILLAAVYVVVVNWGCVIVSIRNARRGIDRHHSTVPLVSFFLTIFGILLFPRPDKIAWIMAVPILDIAHLNIVFAIFWLPVILVRALRKRKSTPPSRNPESS